MRWNTVRCSTSGAMAGTYWTALAPVPIDATRSPATGRLWSQREEWKARPGEALGAGDVGDMGDVEHPEATDHARRPRTAPRWRR